MILLPSSFDRGGAESSASPAADVKMISKSISELRHALGGDSRGRSETETRLAARGAAAVSALSSAGSRCAVDLGDKPGIFRDRATDVRQSFCGWRRNDEEVSCRLDYPPSASAGADDLPASPRGCPSSCQTASSSRHPGRPSAAPRCAQSASGTRRGGPSSS